MTLQPATRATIAGTVTVAVWSARVIARVLHLLAELLADMADAADMARGRTAVPAAVQPPAPNPQPTLTP
jgi:hypothetical protein